MIQKRGKLAMIADDLTGACDAGVEFASRGFSCVVPLQGATEESVDLQIFSTETRESEPEEARAKVSGICRRLAEKGIRLIYKKIDSSMRGNCRVEIEAAMQVLGFERAFIVPAFPEMGRRVTSACLFIGDDPSPVLHIPSLFGSDNVRSLKLPEWGPDLARVQAMFVIDASTRQDLVGVARLCRDELTGSLLVGSAGLAAEIAELFSEGRSQTHLSNSESKCSEGPVVFVVGSSHPNTVAQVEFLRGTQTVRFTRPVFGWQDHARLCPQNKLDIVVEVETESVEEVAVAGLGNIITDAAPRALVMTGGHTASIVCRLLGARAIRPSRNILPGIPLSFLRGGVADGRPVVTKSGGFGAPDTLFKIARSLRGEELS